MLFGAFSRNQTWVKYIKFHFVFEKPHIFITKQYLNGACCHGNQNHRFDNTFRQLMIQRLYLANLNQFDRCLLEVWTIFLFTTTKVSKLSSPHPNGNGPISHYSTRYQFENKQILKIQVISFNSIPNSLCLLGGATKLNFQASFEIWLMD